MFRQILVAGLTGGLIAFVLSGMQNAVLPAGAPRAMPEQPAILAALRTIPQAGFLSHFAINADDLPRARRFYEKCA